MLLNIVVNMYFVFRDMVRTCRRRFIAKCVEMRKWDAGIPSCNCKCFHCGMKDASAVKEMKEATKLVLKPVKCSAPMDVLIPHRSHFNKVEKTLPDPTEQAYPRLEKPKKKVPFNLNLGQA